MELGEQRRLVDAGEFLGLEAFAKRRDVEIEAHHVAPAGTRSDGFRRTAGEAAAQVQVVRVVFLQGLGHLRIVGLGMQAQEGREVGGHVRIPAVGQALGRPGGFQRLPVR